MHKALLAQDGGGAGRSGDTFQGGGIASMLANAIGIAPSGPARERDLELAANAAAGVALKPDVVKPVLDAEKGLLVTTSSICAEREMVTKKVDKTQMS